MKPETAAHALRTYVNGFVASIILTVGAYTLVVNHALSGWPLVFGIVALALVQLLVQLVFFLHLGRETKPRWKLVVFLFMLMVIIIFVTGSLWIMNNLNYHMLTPDQMNAYMKSQDGF